MTPPGRIQYFHREQTTGKKHQTKVRHRMQDFNLSSWCNQSGNPRNPSATVTVNVGKVVPKKGEIALYIRVWLRLQRKNNLGVFLFKWLKYKSQNVVRLHHNLGEKLNRTHPACFVSTVALNESFGWDGGTVHGSTTAGERKDFSQSWSGSERRAVSPVMRASSCFNGVMEAEWEIRVGGNQTRVIWQNRNASSCSPIRGAIGNIMMEILQRLWCWLQTGMNIFVKLWFHIPAENTSKVLSVPLSARPRKCWHEPEQHLSGSASVSLILSQQKGFSAETRPRNSSWSSSPSSHFAPLPGILLAIILKRLTRGDENRVEQRWW